MEEMLKTCPRRLRSRPRSASSVAWNGPVRFVARIRYHVAGESSGNGWIANTPALLTSTSSTFPEASSVCATPRSTESRSVTSISTARPAPPTRSTSRATRSISARVRAATATRAPSRAKRRAMARPIPRPPPVTRTLGPWSTWKSIRTGRAGSPATISRPMAWTQLAQQFLLELGFGVLLALAFVPDAPVGALFYRLMGTCAVLPVAAALAARLQAGVPWSDPAVVAAALVLAAYPVYSGPARGSRWKAGLAAGLLGSAVATGWIVRQALPELAPFGLLVGVVSSLSTGTVAGSVGLAMVLGHWYLTVPKLEIRHLVRLNRVTVAAMLASLASLGTACLVCAETLARAEPPLFGPWGLFYLGTRLAVGLALPLLFAAMAASALRFRNTRSATGILYASTVLVLIGTAVSVFLQDSYRVPL